MDYLVKLLTSTEDENSTVLNDNGTQTNVPDDSNITDLMDIDVIKLFFKIYHKNAKMKSSASEHKQLDAIINMVIRNICLEIIDLAQEIELYEIVHCDITDLLDKLQYTIFKM